MQSPHPTQRSGLNRARPSTRVTAACGQTWTHLPHPLQASISKHGRPACCSAFPEGGAQPIARFLIAPPNPARSWPLTCERTSMLSASRMPPAILTLSKWFPPTATSRQ
ncbi:MAG: hypothetical protein BWX50_01188 [Euryarchaeota archaeon ADurb.Bin009]|nr:MAG: hypothetical protein BWX50_01188 [Euryarchaeota archaeon ADurb.Bin009]